MYYDKKEIVEIILPPDVTNNEELFKFSNPKSENISLKQGTIIKLLLHFDCLILISPSLALI